MKIKKLPKSAASRQESPLRSYLSHHECKARAVARRLKRDRVIQAAHDQIRLAEEQYADYLEIEMEKIKDQLHVVLRHLEELEADERGP